MAIEYLSSLVVFALVSSITPGPNNMMLLASGVNYGIKKTVPHMLGVGIGFCLMVVLVGIGVMQIFEFIPYSYSILMAVSVVYLLYLAWKIATSSSKVHTNTELMTAKPISFIQAVMFQWVNPKAWVMAVTAISVYAPTHQFESILWVALVFGIVNLPSVAIWAFLGQLMQHFLNNTKQVQWFNWTLAILLVGSLYPMLV